MFYLFAGLINAHLAYGNIEISGHFGRKLGGEISFSEPNMSINGNDKYQLWHLGADIFYRHSVKNASLGLGFRYRFDFQGEKRAEIQNIANEFTTHRIALLLNYRFVMKQVFVGAMLGLDIWKSLKFLENFGDDVRLSGTIIQRLEMKSNHFVWNRLGGQLGLEFGIMPTSNFLFKLETGYDILSFSDSELEYHNYDAVMRDEAKISFNSFYITLGIGVLFG